MSHDTRYLGFIPGLLVKIDKYIKVADRHFITAKKTGAVKINMCEDIGKPLISTLYNVLLAPELYDRLFTILMSVNLGYSCLFHKGFCTVFFIDNEQNVVTLPHSAQEKHVFLLKTKETLYTTSYNEQTSDIITFAHLEEGGLVKNECNAEEDGYISASIDELSIDDDSDELYIGSNYIEDIRDGRHIHQEINARYYILKIRYRIKQNAN